jgi:RimJ/RimL family protein N-acetyltransferase
MTLSEDVGRSTQRERSIPVLETKRLTLRAPRHEDVKAIAVLANDRRIAENTTRIPHPYRLADAEAFVANVNLRDGEACFVLILDGTLIGACGIDQRDEGAELGYWLGAGHWGNGLMTEAARAVIDYGFGDLRHETLQSGARVTNPASRRVLEKMRISVDGRAPDPHPRHSFGGAGRSFSARSRSMAVAQVLGAGPPRGVRDVIVRTADRARYF